MWAGGGGKPFASNQKIMFLHLLLGKTIQEIIVLFSFSLYLTSAIHVVLSSELQFMLEEQEISAVTLPKTNLL